jgi:hypothetical protein
MSYLIALTLTLAIELPITVGLLRFWLRASFREAVLLTIAGNLITHPIVWFIAPVVPPQMVSPDLALTLMEVLAMIIEALVLRTRIERRFSSLLIITFISNSASLLVGTALI